MPNLAIMNETILAVKEYLDGQLAKYKTWDEAQGDKFITLICGHQGGFTELKKEGAGRKAILSFLGPEWKRSIVQIALSILKTPKVGTGGKGTEN